MGLRFAKKGEVPDELPNLGIDEGKEKTLTDIPSLPKESKEVEKVQEIRDELDKETKTELSEKTDEKEDPSFFNDILKDINKELNSLKKLESWCDRKILQKDIVSEMKDYWEKQKPSAIVQIIGKRFRGEIIERINGLEKLEREWKELSIKIIEKEDEMKKEERKLKELLSEFTKACKEKLKSKKKKAS